MEAATAGKSLVVAIDMGSNSFKLLLARSLSGGRFLPVLRLKEPLPLLRGASFSAATQLRAISALRSLTKALDPHPVRTIRLVATAAIRDAPNRSDFLAAILAELGLRVDVISGEEEARLIYLGVLQFLPVFEKSVLVVDIGGGSTEFMIGKQGRVLFANSLKLGHVALTEEFVKGGNLEGLRRYVREVIENSGLAEKSRELGGFEMAIGSSGTVRSIGRAIARDLVGEEFRMEWGFSREELRCLVEKIGVGEVEKVRSLGFSKRRAVFIMAGALLLLEIFEALGIGQMKISGYGLAEGVVSEMIAKEGGDCDWSANSRWRSVVRLAVRFDGENRMKSAVGCVVIAKEIFHGIKRFHILSGSLDAPISFVESDLEYLEAALLLHNIGMVIGKKGYHKQSYWIIKNCGHLHGYSSDEVELIALLARYHRKKFPRQKNTSLQELPAELKQKFRALCAVIRISFSLQQCQSVAFEGVKVLQTHESFKMVMRMKEVKHNLSVSDGAPLTRTAIEEELEPELKHFEEVFHHTISVLVLQSTD